MVQQNFRSIIQNLVLTLKIVFCLHKTFFFKHVWIGIKNVSAAQRITPDVLQTMLQKSNTLGEEKAQNMVNLTVQNQELYTQI